MTQLTVDNASVTQEQADLINTICEAVIREAGYDPSDESCDDVAIDVLSLVADLDNDVAITLAARDHMGLPPFC